MYIPQSYYTHFALEAILEYMENQKMISVSYNDVPDELKVHRACFVSVYVNNEMRGCMGTYEPTNEMLIDEIIQNSIHAAFNDERFEPVSQKEIDYLSIKVELVGNDHQVTSMDEVKALDIGTWGVKVKDSVGNVGLILPGTEGLNNSIEAVNAALKKGGITEKNPMNLTLYKFRVRAFW